VNIDPRRYESRGPISPNEPETTEPVSFAWPDYRSVWRWHFYAGVFSIPFLIVLSITGAIYLFKPQIEAWENRPFEALTLDQPAKPLAQQAEAAMAAFPGSRFHSFELPPGESDAGRVMVTHGGRTIRCYVNPVSLELMHSVAVDDRFINVVKTLHGELLLGDRGSYLVELAACWTIVMILTGMFLWWPRKWTGLAGVIYPRLMSGKKPFWRDLHSVTGIWISAFAVILIVTGLPWAAFWGEYFKSVRGWTGTAVVRQDWSTGRGTGQGGHEHPAAAEEAADEHAHHRPGVDPSAGDRPMWDLTQLDRVVATVRPIPLAHPVIIAPPKKNGEGWGVQSMAGNRPLRANLTVDGRTGEVTSRDSFGDRHWVDRMVGTGIALHEGQLFGWLNQAIGLVTALGLVLLSASGTVLWWRRRKVGLLDAPKPASTRVRGPILWGSIVLLAVQLPLFGASLLFVLALQWLVRKRIPFTRVWLGLA
jgi:uncharacterized iron-regulated membrane protein